MPAMRDELEQLGVAPGLDEAEFGAWVAAAIGQTRLVFGVMQGIDATGRLTEKDLAQLCGEIGIGLNDRSARAVLEVLERWLSYFLPDKYQTTQDSIKLIRVKEV